jgi:hypothetical protein
MLQDVLLAKSNVHEVPKDVQESYLTFLNSVDVKTRHDKHVFRHFG